MEVSAKYVVGGYVIAYLRGRVLEVAEDHVVVETQGVGYQVFSTREVLAKVQVGQENLELFIYTQFREDALLLFGFLSKVERAFFLALLKVNGVGPKMALNILSSASVDRLKDMVDRGDVKALTALPKVGKKTAEQIVLTLKGQLVLSDAGGAVAFRAREEISFALCNLGFKSSDVDKILDQMDPGVDVTAGIRLGLQALSQA